MKSVLEDVWVKDYNDLQQQILKSGPSTITFWQWNQWVLLAEPIYDHLSEMEGNES